MSITADSAPTEDAAGRTGYGRGALLRACTWLAGYLVVYVSRADAVSESLRRVGVVSELLGGEAIPAWKGVAWLFANAHFVDVRAPTLVGGTRTVNAVTGDGSTLLLALPPVVLAVAGALAPVGRNGDLTEHAAVGASVTLGYLPMSAATALFATHAVGDTGATISPDPVTGTLLAGVVYPAAFGALGGVAVGELT